MGEQIEVEDSLELEYDMWDGQFDFVGPQGPPPEARERITSDASLTEDLFSGGPLTPHLPNGVNGGKKTPAHQWCDNLSDQVRLLFLAMFLYLRRLETNIVKSFNTY